MSESLEKQNVINNITVHGNVTNSNLIAGENNNVSSSKTEEVFFDAGNRMRQVREEINLKSSEFIEVLGLSSERKYIAMEEQKDEIPLSLLEKINTLTGISLEWLKHGNSQRYNVEFIHPNDMNKGVDYFEKMNPQEYFLTLESKSLHVGFAIKTEGFCYQVFETQISLDFWGWLDDHWVIPIFYNFLKDLRNHQNSIGGVILDKKYDKDLYGGNVHFLGLDGSQADLFLLHLLDIEEKIYDANFYSRIYNGNWINKVHSSFKAHLESV
jgi:hypothetical protein